MEISFIVLGTPKALKRHRNFTNHTTGFKGQYDPSKEDKRTFLDLALEYKPEKPLNEPLFVRLCFCFPRPKNHYGTGKNSNTLKNNVPEFVAVKPDIDNLTKYVLDALNGVFWRDDSLIVIKYAEKIYTNGTPATEVIIQTINS